MGKVEKFIFYLFVFLLPFQIGKFLYAFPPLPESFYHQISIYFSDVLIIALLALWKIRILKDGDEKKRLYIAFKKDFLLILFFIFAGVSVFIADYKYLSVFHFIKLFEFIAFYFYIRQNFQYINIKKFAYTFISSMIFQVFIADAQFNLQKDIGLKYLGESPLSPILDGVAKINEKGFKLIRSYGTFPHPNIFAAFLTFALFMTYFALFNNKAMPASRQAEIGQNTSLDILNRAKKSLPYFALFLLMLGLVLTFSRSAIGMFILMNILFFIFLIFKKGITVEKINISKIAIIVIFIFMALGFVFNKELFFRSQDIISDASLSQRIFYNDIAQNQIISSPIFGVGIGNFIAEFYRQNSGLMNWQYQPAHNLFLLAAAEIGLLSALLLVIFIIRSLVDFIRKTEKNIFQWSVFFVMLIFLALANIDHYFWTLQQGQILLWMVFGVLNSCKSKERLGYYGGIDKLA